MQKEKGMGQKNTVDVKRAGKELTFTRIFDASQELVWKAWTDPHKARCKLVGPKWFFKHNQKNGRFGRRGMEIYNAWPGWQGLS